MRVLRIVSILCVLFAVDHCWVVPEGFKDFNHYELDKFINDKQGDIDLFTDQEPSTPMPTTSKPTIGPNDLTTTDYIIISVTCVVVGGILIGGTTYACIQNNKANKEKDAMYDKYLDKDPYANIDSAYNNPAYSRSENTGSGYN